jgi:hypothetical protein
VRLALLDALVLANGAGELTQGAWEGAFAAAARSLRVRVLGESEQFLRAAAAHSRYPMRRLQARLPDEVAAEKLLNQLLAAGMPLERLDGLADDPVSRRARAAALDSAWENAVALAIAETARWRGIAATIALWRRPTLTVWLLSGGLFVVATVLASWLSGIIASPNWFHPVNDFWWRLWP